MNKKTLLLSFIFMSLLLLPLGSSPGPNLHLNGLDEILADPTVNDTLIANMINENYDACLAGLEYPDVGIFEYYTNFKAYAQLHDYNVVEEMLRVARNDRDKTFAYCYKIHLAEDSPSHNFYVPAAIRRTKLPNYIIHPIQELKVEGRYLDPRANRLMERHEEFDWLVEKATGRDWSKEADNLNLILGGGNFYSKAYKPETTSWLGKFQNAFYRIIEPLTSEETEVDLRKLMIEEGKAVLRGETGSLDPSGERALMEADKQTQLWLYIGTAIIIIIIFFITWRWRIIGFSREKFKIR